MVKIKGTDYDKENVPELLTRAAYDAMVDAKVEALTSRLPKEFREEADGLFMDVYSQGAEMGAKAVLAVVGLGFEVE